MKGIPVSDLISLIVGLIGLITAWISQSNRLPSWTRYWAKKLGRQRLEQAVAEAAKFAGMAPEDRKAAAVRELQRLAANDLGLKVPNSVANLLVEYAYQIYKRRTGI